MFLDLEKDWRLKHLADQEDCQIICSYGWMVQCFETMPSAMLYLSLVCCFISCVFIEHAVMCLNYSRQYTFMFAIIVRGS